MSESLRILGIDPGLNHTGFGVIDVNAGQLRFVTAGCIHVPAGELCERLAFIHRQLSAVIEETHPTLACSEIVFVNINPKSTLLLGQARGAAIACAAVHNLRVMEFTPSEIKRSVVGTGRANKEQVQAMMRHLLGLTGDIQADAADALACAVTCAHAMKLTEINRTAAVISRTGVRSFASRSNRRNAWEQLVKNRTES